MSRHHNTKHDDRGTSHYQTRIGMMGTSGHLPAIEGNAGLRAKQDRRVRLTCTIGVNHDGHECNGKPFPFANDEDE